MAKVSASSVILDEQGRRLLQFLVAQLPSAKPNDPRTFVSYKEIHDALQLQQEGPTFGDSLKQQGLSSLAEWSAKTGKPGITGLIINKTKLVPGDGYFRLFGKSLDDYGWWRSEIEKSKNFPWESFLSSNEAESEATRGEGWSKDELRASVAAYFEMQHLDRTGIHFTKKNYYDSLTTKFGRTAKAFEYRMQNISYVLSLMGRDWLSGLKPAKNVGANVAAQIEELIAELEGKLVTPVVAFEISVREDVKKYQLPMPQGSHDPKTVSSTITQYQRDAAVKAWVLKQANGICESCSQSAPFSGSDGFPFLEVHHVRQLAEKGSDTTDNAVAVCPNCHRELHYGERAKNLVEMLYQKITRLRRE
jgi:predicted HNH restriction endonuclease